MKKSGLVMLFLVGTAFLLSAYLYPEMPGRMATHWNAGGEPDGTLPKAAGAFMVPGIMALLAGLFAAVPRIDPLGRNLRKFRKQYGMFAGVVMGFLLVVHAQILLWNAGILISPLFIFPLGIAALFYAAGILCENSRQNWFVGIRTPWTLSSSTVWKETHRLGAKLFKWAAAASLASVLVPDYSAAVIIASALIVAVFSTAYSYVLYRRETQGGKK
ncbi:SdpI family protein [Candidatus Woesearchaeota archaeon]|nr:MAG: SdpI family protein [Candidatus Woesearchaeota archaeon]